MPSITTSEFRRDSPSSQRITVIAIAAIFVLFQIFLGAITQIPLPVALTVAAVIGGWLTHFAVREHRAHRRPA
jgi:LytS/YehU family sensor histidine kinase